ncbi:MAG: DNA polymerase domain-containing protein [Methanobacteriota archaeon]
MSAWLFDAQADIARDEMQLWLWSERGIEKRTDAEFRPELIVWHGSREELRSLAGDMEIMDSVDSTRLVRRKLRLGSDKLYAALAVRPRRYSDLRVCARVVDSRGGYRDYQLFNADLRPEQSYLVSRGLFPMARVRANGGISLDDEQFALDYEMPHLREASLSVSTIGRLPSMASKLVCVGLGDAKLTGSEEEILRALGDELRKQDPDVLYTDGGDSFAVPYLLKRAEANGVRLVLGREPQTVDSRAGRSYFTYGTIVYKPRAQLLRGRFHMDRESFMLSEGGFDGLIDMARLSGLPMQAAARLTPGSAISAMQVQLAMRDGYAIAWKKNAPEDFKGADELLMADRGGMIYDPRVGLYENVVEVDFTSLYPNIMARHNISPETLLCQCCPDSRARVPGLLYNICERRRGLIPRVVEPLVERRMRFKRLIREDPRNEKIYLQRASLLKWVLVTCFGYTGYRNSRFGRIECHEAINAYAREILVRTKELAESHGYNVLHGIIDSMWLSQEKSDRRMRQREPRSISGVREDEPQGRAKVSSDHEWFCERVSAEIGIPLALEGVYKWIVFLPTRNTGAGALNKYYGCFENGELKVRGIELRKHDAPPVVKDAQKEMLDILSKAADAEGFRALVPEALAALERRAKDVAGGRAGLDRLVIAKRISRGADSYGQRNDQAAALRLLKAAGQAVHPGELVRFVLTTDGAVPAELLRGDEIYDGGRYIDLLARAGESLFCFTGLGRDAIQSGWGEG